MALRNYLVDGISGSGKTTVGQELRRRGCLVTDADEDLAFFGDPITGRPTDRQSQLDWIWHPQKTDALLRDRTEADRYVCGGSMNQDRFLHLFTLVFTLIVDNDTLYHRLTARPDDGLCRQPDYVATQLRWNLDEQARPRGTILIDATPPVDVVVEHILDHVKRSRLP